MTRDPASVVLERTVELARVPAPPLDEADRAEIVTGWWRRDGLEPHIDQVGNVVARLRTGRGPALFVAAHLDTVFGRDVPHGTEQRSGRLHGVGVGDNTVAVAALSVMDRLLPRDLDRPVWIAATVGEEGFGNLTGARHLVEHPPAEIGAMVALEGNYLGRVVTVGVGSVRWLAELEGPGGTPGKLPTIPAPSTTWPGSSPAWRGCYRTPATRPGVLSTWDTSKAASRSTLGRGGQLSGSISAPPTPWFSPILMPQPVVWCTGRSLHR